MPIEFAVGLEQRFVGDAFNVGVVEMGENGRLAQRLGQAALPVKAVQIVPKRVVATPNVTQPLPAQFQALGVALGEHGHGPRNPPQGRKLAKNFALLDRGGTVPVENRGNVLEEDMDFVRADVMCPGIPFRRDTGGVADLGISRVGPQLGQGIEDPLLLRGYATEQGVGQSRSQHRPQPAVQDQESRTPVIAGADDDVTLWISPDPGIVSDDFAQRRRPGKPGGVHVREGLDGKHAIHLGLAHIGGKRLVPPCGRWMRMSLAIAESPCQYPLRHYLRAPAFPCTCPARGSSRPPPRTYSRRGLRRTS